MKFLCTVSHYAPSCRCTHSTPTNIHSAKSKSNDSARRHRDGFTSACADHRWRQAGLVASIWLFYDLCQYLVTGLIHSMGLQLTYIVYRGFTFIFGVFQNFYELSYIPSESSSAIAWVGTVQSALLSIGGVLSGGLYDLGAYRLMTVSGAFLVLLGLFMLSLSKDYYQIFLSQGICIGIGGALLYVPALALVGGAFKRRRAMAMGILTCGIGLGESSVLQRNVPDG